MQTDSSDMVGELESSSLNSHVVPDYLQRVVKSCTAPQSQAEAIIVLVHAAFLESGLQLSTAVSTFCTSMPSTLPLLPLPDIAT